jgi:hypothetical protein
MDMVTARAAKVAIVRISTRDSKRGDGFQGHGQALAGACAVSQEQYPSRTEFEPWHANDAGGPNLRLPIRYREGVEVPNWHDGPELSELFEQAGAEGWYADDREPGQAPGEYVTFYTMRQGPADGQPR